jgi:uncharacterized protein (TIGR03067 family)
MFAALALVTFATAPVPKGAEKAALQGEWKVNSFYRSGKAQKLDAAGAARVTFAGNTVRIAVGGLSETGTFTADAANVPAHIDLVLADTQPLDTGDPRPPYALKGVFKLDGAELTLYLVDGPERPKAIPLPKECADHSALLVLVREKKK